MPRNKSTKKKILFAAIDCFSEKTYKHCTMQEIADRVNIKAPSIYKHFINKKEILTQIFEYYKSGLNNRRLPIEEIVEAIDRDPLGEVFTKFFVILETENEYLTIMKISKIIMDLSHENKEARKIYLKVFIDDPTKYLTDIFTRLIDSGKIKPFDYETLIFQIISFSVMSFELSLQDRTDLKTLEIKYKNGINFLANAFERADLLIKKPMDV